MTRAGRPDLGGISGTATAPCATWGAGRPKRAPRQARGAPLPRPVRHRPVPAPQHEGDCHRGTNIPLTLAPTGSLHKKSSESPDFEHSSITAARHNGTVLYQRKHPPTRPVVVSLDAVNGGGAWESNPPIRLFAGHAGVEGQCAAGSIGRYGCVRAPWRGKSG